MEGYIYVYVYVCVPYETLIFIIAEKDIGRL